ncbi:hypothetical protein [Nitrosopumilus sp.]|uniref:hypothetical protein n=1 Tax=Nitrosopumilus sp. TaxID=2024843 RepID=UPI00292E2064|nr:hypothetical protein [Nitrosopumilus sp.]
MIFALNNQGPVITLVGLVAVGISFSIAASVVPPDLIDQNDLSMSTLFEGMFDEIHDEIQILPGDSAYFSYDTISSEFLLLWGVQIIDYESGDKLMISISNIFGDDYGEFIQDGPILFEILEITTFDTLNLEIYNQGTQNVTIVVMFSEDPDNSDIQLDPDFPLTTMILPFAISGFLLILGIVISTIGVIIILIDWKNIQNNKRSY